MDHFTPNLILVIPQNYEKRYKYTIFALKTGLNFEASIIYIQKLFLEKKSLIYLQFNLYSSFEMDKRKNIQVLTVVKKDILSKIVIENQTNLVSHLYCMVIDIRELDLRSEKSLKKTRIVNLYDNQFRKK